jgi:hypothetical protein
MSKVISIFTKKELKELPFQEDAALEIIKYVLSYKEDNFLKISMAERLILDSILRYVANASGTNPNQLMVDALQEILPTFGDAS